MNEEIPSPLGGGASAPATRHPLGRVGGVVTLLVVAVVVAAVAFVGEALGRQGSASSATISVTGSGTVRGTPNTMSFEIGVTTTAPSATAALAANSKKMRTLIDTLLANGLTKANLQTSGLYISENTNDRGVVTGFTVENQLDATTHELGRAGTALDAAARVAGNDVELYGVTFSISNQSKLLAAARARAIQNAHLEASEIARGAHTAVESIVKVTDEENTPSTGVTFGPLMMQSAASAVPIEAGSQSVTVQVAVVYRLGA